jgi:tocopherol O-methyltransferase
VLHIPQFTREDIQSYYTQTAFDYRVAWLNGSNLALHFGYHIDDSTSHSASLTASNQVLADLAQVTSGDRVLDAGCGLGGTSLWLAKAKHARVVGIALGEDQVSAARAEATRRSLGKSANFLVADFSATPFPTNSFDVVWAQESLCHANHKAKFFHEASRLLKPKGRLVIADFMLKRAAVNAADRAMLAEWYGGWKLPGLWTAAEHAKAARTAGLIDVLIQDVTANTLRSHRRLYERARRALPFAMLLSLTGLRNSMQNDNLVGALRQYQTLRNDCWLYALFLARKP